MIKTLLALAILVANIGMEWFKSQFDTYDKMQKCLHELAEPGYVEHKSAELIIKHLEEHGFKVERGVANIPTAFVATFGEGKPVMGVLAEYDALPGLSQDTTACFNPRIAGGYGHGCGHNLIGTAAVSAAVAVSKWLAEGHKGTIKLFGCPAEEGGGGKTYMVREGLFDDVDCAISYHPTSCNQILHTSQSAKIGVLFNFIGKSSHAGSTPHNGRSALDGVEAMNFMMNLNREHIHQDCRVHYIITDGGEAPNIVPDKAQVYYYLRHPNSEVAKELLKRTIAAAEGAAMGTGTAVKYEFLSGTYSILRNNTLAKIAHRNLVKVGGVKLTDAEKEYVRALNGGADKNRPIDLTPFERVEPFVESWVYGGGSSDDTGDVSQVVPLCRVETCANIIGIHTWQFSSIVGTSIGTKAMLNAAKTIYLTLIELYQKPKELQKIREEWESVQGKDYKYESIIGNAPPALEYFRKKAESAPR
ncbi:MAG: amidohydrolase [Rikenellaceae bacterium]|nr:amidohydrolase [Rikenellaceae bacterium]